MNEVIQNIKETQYILLNRIDLSFKRSLYNKIDFRQKMIGIIGPRGVGKTTLILQYLKEKHYQDEKSIYLSADNVLFKKGDLLNLVREFYLKYGGRLVCLDEIHRYENWNQELKNIYDTFPDLRIIFSGSSSLSLVRGKYDLSRRGIVYNLEGLSFREYLSFKHSLHLKSFDLDYLVKNYQDISLKLSKISNILKYFNQYLIQGYYPFFKETNNRQLYFQQINNAVNKNIYEDIISFYQLKTQNLIVFKQILYFLSTIKPGNVSVNKLAHNLGKNYATIAEYLNILSKARLIRFLPSDKNGYSLIRRAKKAFLDNPNLMWAITHNLGHKPEIGTIRELFVLNQLQNAGYIPVYPNRGDLTINNYTFEIGGKSKHIGNLKSIGKMYLALDDIIVASKNRIPLYLFGFLY